MKLAQLLKLAQHAQAEIAKIQDELQFEEVEAQSGGGMVKMGGCLSCQSCGLSSCSM